MTTNEILQLDCRLKENECIIQRVLRKIKPLASCPDGQVPLSKLERCMHVLARKYDYVLSIHADVGSNSEAIIWRCSVLKYGRTVATGSNVFGCSVYEAIAKAVILMYSHSRRVSK